MQGLKALGDWTSARAAEYELVAQRRDVDGPMIDRALEIVRQFIIDRKLILFGGLAIDYALRLKGDRIYPDDQRPDFDFISTRSVDDAYDLADILFKTGFEDVGTVRGIHVQTMRVRTDFIWVADIGYAPPEVFNNIPTFVYNGMLVVHPDYQRMDMHLAFCFPFNNPPHEDVFNRWSKDLKRFNLLEKYYPIVAEDSNITFNKIIGNLPVPVIGNFKTLMVALHGFSAYAITRTSLDELATAFKEELPKIKAPYLTISFPNNNTIEIDSPGLSIEIASPYPNKVTTGIVTKYEPYMDLYPESYCTNNIVISSTEGRQLAVSHVKIADKLNAIIVSPHYLQLWFLFKSLQIKSYRAFYVHMLEIINCAEEIYLRVLSKTNDIETKMAIVETFISSPFGPVLTTFGNINHNAAYVIKMANNAAKLQDVPPSSLNLDKDIANLLKDLPSNYYPASSKQRPTFDYTANALFRRAGAKIE
jgi:hypothetical protein